MARIPEGGAVAYRLEQGEARFLLVTAKSHPDRWIFPKGRIEDGEEAARTALRELREEAGVRANLVGPLGRVKMRTSRGKLTVEYFLVSFLDEGTPELGRERRWVPYAEARALLSHEDIKIVLDQANALVDNSPETP